MSAFGEPSVEYSFDDGKTWREGGPVIGATCHCRVVHNGKVLWSGHAISEEVVCTACNGKGTDIRHRYVEDEKGEAADAKH